MHENLTFCWISTTTRHTKRCGHHYAIRRIDSKPPAWLLQHIDTADGDLVDLGAFPDPDTAERHANHDLVDRLAEDAVDVAGYLAALVVGFTIFAVGGLGTFLALVEVFGR